MGRAVAGAVAVEEQRAGDDCKDDEVDGSIDVGEDTYCVAVKFTFDVTATVGSTGAWAAVLAVGDSEWTSCGGTGNAVAVCEGNECGTDVLGLMVQNDFNELCTGALRATGAVLRVEDVESSTPLCVTVNAKDAEGNGVTGTVATTNSALTFCICENKNKQ